MNLTSQEISDLSTALPDYLLSLNHIELDMRLEDRELFKRLEGLCEKLKPLQLTGGDCMDRLSQKEVEMERCMVVAETLLRKLQLQFKKSILQDMEDSDLVYELLMCIKENRAVFSGVLSERTINLSNAHFGATTAVAHIDEARFEAREK